MFGLTTREVLTKAIVNVSNECIGGFIQAIDDNFDEMNDLLYENLRTVYFDTVANIVISGFREKSPTIYYKIQLELVSPTAGGYDIDVTKGLPAGKLYAICYYAIKGKPAKPADCIKLNHLQYDILDKALCKAFKNKEK